MSHAFRILIATLAVVTSAAAQARWTPPKTPWGDPDLQGIYTSDDLMDTPIERPAEFGERLHFTEGEIAEGAAQWPKQAEGDLQEFGLPNARVSTGPRGDCGERAR